MPTPHARTRFYARRHSARLLTIANSLMTTASRSDALSAERLASVAAHVAGAAGLLFSESLRDRRDVQWRPFRRSSR
jgi:hypothetical protein